MPVNLENKKPEEIYQMLTNDIFEKVERELSSKFVDENKVRALIEEYTRMKAIYHIPTPEEEINKKAFYEWLLAKIKNDYRKEEAVVKEYAQSFKQVTTAAGALVPYYFIEQMIKKVEELAWHRKYCTVVKVGSARGWVPKEGEGCVAYWTAEGVAPTPSAPTFGQVDFLTYELKVRCYISEKLIETAGIDITDFIIYLMAKATAKEEFKVLIQGNGTNKWKGLNAYTDADGMNILTPTALDYDTLIEAIFKLEPDDLTTATWIANKQMLAQLYQLKDATGRPYFDLRDKAILGYEVLANSNVANNTIYFGNLKQYWIFDQATYTVEIERGGDELRSKSLVGVYSRNDSDGKLVLPSSFVRIIIGGE